MVQLYDLSHFASCMFWGFHSIASEQSSVVDYDHTSLVVSKECAASVRHWVVHEACQKGLCGGDIGKVWPVSSWMDKHISTHSPLSLNHSHHTWARHLYLPATNWSDLAIYPCHMMYFGILDGPLDPFRCSNMIMAPHTQKCSSTSQERAIIFHHVIFHCQIYHTHSMCY